MKKLIIIILLLTTLGLECKNTKTIYHYKIVGWATQRPNVQGIAYLQYTLPNQNWEYCPLDNWHLVSGSTNSYTASDEVYLTSGYFISLNCVGLNINSYSLICVVNLDTGSVLWIESKCNAGPTFKINYILP